MTVAEISYTFRFDVLVRRHTVPHSSGRTRFVGFAGIRTPGASNSPFGLARCHSPFRLELAGSSGIDIMIWSDTQPFPLLGQYEGFKVAKEMSNSQIPAEHQEMKMGLKR